MSVLQDMQKKVQFIGLLPDHVDRRVTAVFAPETATVVTVRGWFGVVSAYLRNMIVILCIPLM